MAASTDQAQSSTFTFHITCSRCHHFHIARPFTLSSSGCHQRYLCDKCKKPLFGVGSNSTQLSLASVCTSSSWEASCPEYLQIHVTDADTSESALAPHPLEAAQVNEPSGPPTIAVSPPSSQVTNVNREITQTNGCVPTTTIEGNNGSTVHRNHLQYLLSKLVRVAKGAQRRGRNFVGRKTSTTPQHVHSSAIEDDLREPRANSKTQENPQPQSMEPSVPQSLQRLSAEDIQTITGSNRPPSANKRLQASRRDKTLRREAIRKQMRSCHCSDNCDCHNDRRQGPPPNSQPSHVNSVRPSQGDDILAPSTNEDSLYRYPSNIPTTTEGAIAFIGSHLSDSGRPTSSHNSSSELDPSPHASRQSTSNLSQATTAVGSGISGARRESLFRTMSPRARELREFMQFTERTRPDLISVIRTFPNFDRSESPAPIDPSTRNSTDLTGSTDFAFSVPERQNSNLSVSRTADELHATRDSSGSGLPRLDTTGDFSSIDPINAQPSSAVGDEPEYATPRTAIPNGSNERTPQPQSPADVTRHQAAVSRPAPSDELADAIRRASHGEISESNAER